MENNSNKEIEETKMETTEENIEHTGIEQKEPENTIPNGECWALVCYTEKTFFQKITYSLKKLFIYTKNRILGNA